MHHGDDLYRSSMLMMMHTTYTYYTLQKRGPTTPPPEYGKGGGGLVDGLLYRFFRKKVVERLGQDSADRNFPGLIELIRKMNSIYSTKRETQIAAQDILR